jgi:hypothetical protein
MDLKETLVIYYDIQSLMAFQFNTSKRIPVNGTNNVFSLFLWMLEVKASCCILVKTHGYPVIRWVFHKIIEICL